MIIILLCIEVNLNEDRLIPVVLSLIGGTTHLLTFEAQISFPQV